MAGRTLVALLIGIYSGIFLDQRYKIPKVDDPKALYDKISEWMVKYKKDGKEEKE